MDTIKELRKAARAHRDEKIRITRQECSRTLADLDRIALRMDVPIKTHWSPPAEGQSSTDYALAILAERGPLTVLEITVEAQGRGYRPSEKPRRVSHAFRSTMKYHSDRFIKIGEKWAQAQGC